MGSDVDWDEQFSHTFMMELSRRCRLRGGFLKSDLWEAAAAVSVPKSQLAGQHGVLKVLAVAIGTRMPTAKDGHVTYSPTIS